MDRREYNRIATKQHIEQSLLQMLSEGKYLHQISTTELCNAAGIAKSTFYLYFQDKYAVLESIVTKTFAELKSINEPFGTYSVADLVSGKPTPIARNMVAYLSSHKEVFQVLLGPTGMPDFMYQGKSEIESKFKELYRALRMNPKHEQLVASQFFSGVMGLFRFYLFENTDYSNEDMTIIFGNMLRNTLMISDHIK